MLSSLPMSFQLNHVVLTKTVSSREKAGSLSSEIVRISSLFVRIGAATAADAATARQVTFEMTTINSLGSQFLRIQTLDGDFVKTSVALFTYSFVSLVLYGSSVGRDFARLLHALLCVVMEMARIDTNMTETRFVCDFVFAFA